MKNFLSVCLISGFVIMNMYGQDPFHRLYDPIDREHIAMSTVAYSDGYYVLNGILDEDGAIIKTSVTKLNNKGSEVWTYDYTFGEDANYVFLGDMTLLAGDSIAVSLIYSNESTIDGHNKIVAVINPEGELAWSKAVGGYENVDIDTVFVSLETPFDSTTTFFSTYYGQSDQGIEAVNFDEVGMVNWSNKYMSFDELGGFNIIEVIDSDCTETDSSYMLSGVTGKTDLSIGAGITKVDSSGNALWSKIVIDSNGTLLIGSAIDFMSDTTMAIGGSQLDLANGENFGYICYLDSIAQPIWAKDIKLGDGIGNATIVTDVVGTEDNGIMLSGEFLDIFQNQFILFLIKFDKNGDVLWQRQYPRVMPGFVTTGDLIQGVEGLTAYYSTSLQQDQVSFGSNLLIVDEAGASICEDTIDYQIVFDNAVFLDTIEITTVGDTAVIDVMATAEKFDTIYDLTTLVLSDTTYCPQDPIMYTINAEREGSVAYIWNTGDTTSMITVTAEGEYTATVTFEHEKGCYLLCDTTSVATYDTLMMNVAVDWSPWCADRSVNIFTSLDNGQSRPPFTYEWSTGETSTTINVTPPFEGSVTVTDGCSIEVSENFEVNPEDTPESPDDFFIEFDVLRFCDTGEYTLRILSTPSSNVAGLTNVQWFDETGALIASDATEIEVPSFGTYSFSGVDNCMYPVGNDITISDAVLPDIGSIEIIENYDAFCNGGEIQLTVVPNGSNITDYIWSTGQEDVTIISVGQTFGTYTVSAMDCGRPLGYEVTLSETDVIGDVSITIDTSMFCENGGIVLLAEVTGEYYENDLIWNTNETSTEIFVTDFAETYEATATFCGTFEVKADTTLNLDNQIQWPNVFYPINSMEVEEMDKDFGPLIGCPQALTNYELKIYNRWGQLMFETSDPAEHWDGRQGTNNMPSDAYVYYSTYTINGITEEVNGTLSLVR